VLFAELLAALALDRLLGEPRRHPLVAFGALATRVERGARRLPLGLRGAGVVAWGVLVLPPTLLLGWLWPALPAPAAFCLGVAVLYLCLGARALSEHAQAVREPLAQGDIEAARGALARLVSRDTDTLPPPGIATGAVESVLENGNDAVVASLFWYAVAGPAGALCHRLANTLDAMWGYRNARYAQFGWAAARLDDLLGWLPARGCALGYALAGNCRVALRCWRQQAASWDSPNAGPVLAAGAGALGVQLGGPAYYAGRERQRPLLGAGPPPLAGTIDAALRLLWRALWIGLLPLAVWEVLCWT